MITYTPEHRLALTITMQAFRCPHCTRPHKQTYAEKSNVNYWEYACKCGSLHQFVWQAGWKWLSSAQEFTWRKEAWGGLYVVAEDATLFGPVADPSNVTRIKGLMDFRHFINTVADQEKKTGLTRETLLAGAVKKDTP